MIQSLSAVPAAFLLLSGALKLLDLEHFERSLESWEIVPGAMIPALTATVPPIELALGAAYFTMRCRLIVVAGMAGLITMFTVAMLVQLVVFDAPSCGCLGRIEIFESQRDEAIFALARNVILLACISISCIAQRLRANP